jgi:hypothetical protein
MTSGQLSNEEAEKLRQEGREEVLNYLVAQEIINYSSYDDNYFKYDWKNEWLTVFPWRKVQLKSKDLEEVEGHE